MAKRKKKTHQGMILDTSKKYYFYGAKSQPQRVKYWFRDSKQDINTRTLILCQLGLGLSHKERKKFDKDFEGYRYIIALEQKDCYHDNWKFFGRGWGVAGVTINETSNKMKEENYEGYTI